MQYADFAQRRRKSHRAQVAAKVARLADLLEEWEAWDAEQHLPWAARRLRAAPPTPAREALTVLHRALLAELHDLDGAAVGVRGVRADGTA